MFSIIKHCLLCYILFCSNHTSFLFSNICLENNVPLIFLRKRGDRFLTLTQVLAGFFLEEFMETSPLAIVYSLQLRLSGCLL